jgi:hypothetical protein
MAIVNTDEGAVRILFSDASETNRRVIAEFATEQLDQSTDPRQQVIIAKSIDLLEEDDKMIIEVNLMAASNVDYDVAEAFTKMRVPVTVRNKRTGNVFERILRHPNFATADVTVAVASQWVRIGTYTVTAQEQVKLGWNLAENSRLYIQLAETTST